MKLDWWIRRGLGTNWLDFLKPIRIWHKSWSRFSQSENIKWALAHEFDIFTVGQIYFWCSHGTLCDNNYLPPPAGRRGRRLVISSSVRLSVLGTCKSGIFFRIESAATIRIRIESNQGVVVYVFNADCRRSCVGLLTNIDVRILLVPQTILHDRSYSASECVCSWYINIKS